MQEYTKIIVKLPQSYLDLINQIFEIEKKASLLQEANSIQRNVNKLKDLIENELFKAKEAERSFSIFYYNPLGEDYNDTRTDCEVNIAGANTEDLKIIEVIKPIIFYSYVDNGKLIKGIAQKGVVIVKSKNN